MATLFEAYKNRLAISESCYGKAHNGETMDNNRYVSNSPLAALISND